MTDKQISTLNESAARAEDLQNLLDHIAWTDTIQPELQKLRSAYAKVLVNSVLGQPYTTTTNGLVSAVSSEQLAGKIYGIDFIQELFTRILTRGQVAVEKLRTDEQFIPIIRSS